jgi:hypothetical protein
MRTMEARNRRKKCGRRQNPLAVYVIAVEE